MLKSRTVFKKKPKFKTFEDMIFRFLPEEPKSNALKFSAEQ